jgi:hypothetical protein
MSATARAVALGAPTVSAPLTSTHCLQLLDYFRVPHAVVPDARGSGLATLRAGTENALHWPRGGSRRPQMLRLRDIPLCATLMPDAETRIARAALGSGWTAEWPVTDARGERVASVWRSREGSVLLPFDPDEAVRACWTEGYREAAGGSAAKRRAGAVARAAYYAARPLLPRSGQLALRRAFSRVQARAPFPRWPFEPALHDLYEFVFARAAEVAGGPLPGIAPWPHGKRWALVLTHDVETAAGRDSVHVLRDVEAALGYRSSWNFVPRRYADAPELRDALTGAGFEVGLHGLYHDGRDLAPRTFEKRLPEMREYAARWQVSGFRSPATHRDWERMPRLGVDYDTSYTDSAPFEPQAGGCCTWLPYENGPLVELPITLVQDHTLFEILRHADERLWVEKAELLRARGGMALVLTHPDYMLAADRVAAYRRLLDRFAADPTAWRALPREVSTWWRRRAASELVREQGEWRVAGPAAPDAGVELLGSEAVR